MGSSGAIITILSDFQGIFISTNNAELDPGWLFLIGIIELIIGLLILWLALQTAGDNTEGTIILFVIGFLLIVSFFYEIILGTEYLFD